MKFRCMSMCVAVVLAAVGLAAGQTVDRPAGYFALEDLDVFAAGKVEVDIDLRGSMAKIVAAATAKEDPEFSAAMEKIQRIRVQVGSAEGSDPAMIRSTIEGAVKRLEDAGWYRMVAVRDEEDTVYLMALESAGIVQGLTAFVDDGDGEVVLVNIAGEMSPEMIGSLIGNIDQLEGLRDEIEQGLAEQ
jgi:hypothetical protein